MTKARAELLAARNSTFEAVKTWFREQVEEVGNLDHATKYANKYETRPPAVKQVEDLSLCAVDPRDFSRDAWRILRAQEVLENLQRKEELLSAISPIGYVKFKDYLEGMAKGYMHHERDNKFRTVVNHMTAICSQAKVETTQLADPHATLRKHMNKLARADGAVWKEECYTCLVYNGSLRRGKGD